MADQTPSGSRWEPDPGETPLPEPTTELTDDETPSATDPRARRAQLRSRAVVVGAATALALGGGLTGFVIGHSTTGDADNGFRPANFSRQGPGDGQLRDGQVPPGFDRDGDGGPPGGDGSGPSTSGNPT